MRNNFFSKFMVLVLSLAVMLTALPTGFVIASANTGENGTAIADRSGVEADIRIGLFGDTHVTVDPVWTTAEAGVGAVMDAYKTIDPNIDAFAMPGDIIYNVIPSSEKTDDDKVKYQAVIDKMKEDFPNLDYSAAAQADTDSKNKVIWSIGNHEITQNAYKNSSVTEFADGRTWEEEVADNISKYEEFFGHDACYSTTVNGYTFVTAQPYNYLNEYVNPDDKTVMSELETKAKGLLEAALSADDSKPVFYLQHQAIDKTCNMSRSTSPDLNSEAFREFILSNPRIVTFSGHSHAPAQDPRFIWQSENGSTHINIPAVAGNTASYSTVEENADDTEKASQAMLLEVSGSVVTVRRFDVKTKTYIGEPTVFTPGVADAKYTSERITTAKASVVNKPYFADSAAVTVSDITNTTAKVSFPVASKDGESADGLQDSFVHYYNVTVTNKNTGNSTTYKLLGDFWRAAANMRSSRSVAVSSLSKNTEYEVSVVPSSSLGQPGDALTCTFTTANEKTAEELALTKKTDLKNVALKKTIASAGTVSGENANLPLTNIVVGNADSRYVATYAKDAYFYVDLGKRYNVEKVVLDVYTANGNATKNFVLEGSNDPNFPSDKTDPIYTGGSSNAAFADGLVLTVETDGSKDYRYIRYRRTSNAYIVIGELEVYARDYITEVSRNKPVEVSLANYTAYAPSKAVNGVSDKGWWSGYATAKTNAFGTDAIYDYLVVDLEKALPVDLIEIEYPKGIDDNTAARRYWRVYGSTELPASASSTGTTVVTYRPDMATATTLPDTFTQLCTTGSNYLPKYGTTALSMSGNDSTAEGYVSQSVNSAGTAYRYITFKKADKNIAQLGEVRAYVTNPTLNSVNASDEQITLSFSDVMNKTTLTSDNIKVYNTSGVEITGLTLTPSDDGYEVVITDAEDAQRVELNYNIMSSKGVEIAGTLTRYIALSADYDGKPVTTEENVNVALGKQVTVSSLTEDATSHGAEAIVDGKAATYLRGTFTADTSVTIDLKNRFNVEKIVLTTDGVNSQAGHNYEIQLSNDENFSEYDVAYSVSSLSGDAFTEASVGAEILLGGDKDYRYVRYQKTSGGWARIAEIEVYADISLMEISRNATVASSATYSASFPNTKAVDGKNTAKTDGWLSPFTPSSNPWLYVDLGMSYPIYRIELESLYDGTVSGANRRYLAIYGSNEMNSSNLDTTNSTAGTFVEVNNAGTTYDLLGKTTNCLPAYNSGEGKGIYMSFDDCVSTSANVSGTLRQYAQEDYRYITFHKFYNGALGIGEARIYTPSPVANSVRLNGKEITLSFSDNMFPDNINSETVILKDESGNVLTQTNGYAEGYEYTFTAEDIEPNKNYTISVSSNIKNLYSMPVAEETIAFTTPTLVTLSNIIITEDTETDEEIVADELKASTSYILTAKMTSIFDTATPVMVVVAEKNQDSEGREKLVKAHVGKATAAANGSSTLTVSFTTGETVGSIIEIFVWDEDDFTPYSNKITK